MKVFECEDTRKLVDKFLINISLLAIDLPLSTNLLWLL
jgi:hypothetical protein